MRTPTVYRYDLPAATFTQWEDACGQWLSSEPVEPLRVEPLGDLLARHASAGVELRIVPSLWPIRDLAVSDRWDFSLVRMANATPRR